MLKKQVPNLITSLNLLSGSLGLVFLFQAEFFWVFIALTLGMLFDFLDGFAARLLRATSNFGKELDSLADLITFGLLPAFLFWKVGQNYDVGFGQYAFLFLILGSAWRLAKFNIDTEQKEIFLGVPTPANAFFIASLSWILWKYPGYFSEELIFFVFPIISVIAMFLMILSVPLLSFKFSKNQKKPNIIRVVFLITSLLLMVIFQDFAPPLIFILYMLLSLIFLGTK